jgi:hypothetical protein
VILTESESLVLNRSVLWAIRNKQLKLTPQIFPKNNPKQTSPFVPKTKDFILWSGRALKKYEAHLLLHKADFEEIKLCQRLLKRLGEYYAKI